MKRVIPPNNGQPIKLWCDFVDDKTMLQAVDLAQHPEVVFPVALMPDAHAGYGMPIGGVIATKNSLIPYAVGMDIGCGMCAVRTGMRAIHIQVQQLKDIIRDINGAIPMGFNQHERPQDLGEWGVDELPLVQAPGEVRLLKPIEQMMDSRTIEHQLGTLGGGNHFIELQKDTEGFLWIMLHSGSRKLGHAVCTYYHKRAKMHCERWHSNCPSDLSFLPFGEQDAADYYECLKYAQNYAAANRAHMLRTVQDIIEDNLGTVPNYTDEVNIHHNFAQQENHFGKNVWVHRKGATQAKEGQIGIIPGSMGTTSYIVVGLGNRESFESCSHGAGRKMGRKEFCRTHDLTVVNNSIKHVVFEGWKTDRKGNVEYSEAPDAYKDIDEVMENQQDLVKPLYKLKPLAVAKG